MMGNMSLGTDQDLAFVKAAKLALPQIPHLLCTLHLKDNLQMQCTDKLVSKERRLKLEKDIFGMRKGLVVQTGRAAFEMKRDEILNSFKDTELPSNSIEQYLKGFLARVETHVWKISQDHLSENLQSFTTNMAESMNAWIKRNLDWKQVDYYSLQFKLNDMLKHQFGEIYEALQVCKN